jgi:hypothetical protein
LFWAKPRLPYFEPLRVPNVIVWSVGSVVIATLLYWYIVKSSKNPPRTFIIVSMIVLLVSFVPNVVFFWIAPGPVLGTPTPGGIFTLMFMHVVAAACIMPLLLWRPTASWAIASSADLSRVPGYGDSISKSPFTVGFALIFALATSAAAHVSYHVPLFTFLYASPAVIGFVLWFVFPARVRFTDLRFPYFLTIAVFVAHIVEERLTNYMPQLMQLAGAVTPEKGTLASVVLRLTPLTWIVFPFLLRKNYSIGVYFAWTFFTAMGVTEMVHFVYPFLRGQPYSYFPGLGTAVLLGPVAWWGMSRLIRSRKKTVVAMDETRVQA